MSHQLFSKWSLLTFALIAVSLSTTGCPGPPPEPMGTLTGTVKSGGEVCGNCRVALHSMKGSSGKTVGESGMFEFKDVPFGDYKITVYQKPTNDPVEVFDDRIPKKYRTATTSGFSVSITSAEPVVLDLEME